MEKKLKKKVMIDESDAVWTTHRGKHISESSVQVKKELKEFLDKSGINLKKEERQKMNMEEVGTIMRKLPQYQSKINGYSLHISLNKQLLDMFKKDLLSEIATEEQNMATGKDSDGNTPKNLISDLSSIMRKGTVSSSNKLRLIMLYSITKGNKEYRDKLVELAKLGDGEKNALYNATTLKPPSTFSFGKLFSSIFNNKQKNQEIDFTLSRYVPIVKELCEDILKGTLSEKEYKYVESPPNSFKIESVSSGKKEVKEEKKEVKSSRFGNAPEWNLVSNNNTNLVGNTETKNTDYKLFVFVIGGITYSEMRSCYELQNEYGIDVMFGGTSILTPKDYVYKLAVVENKKSSEEE